jgi:protein farnesyltransferase subunit beta
MKTRNEPPTGKLFVSFCRLYNNFGLQTYISICQDSDGGLFDKPGKGRDQYHSCYSLSGLSLASYPPEKETAVVVDKIGFYLERTDAVYNISKDKLEFAREYFKNKPAITK